MAFGLQDATSDGDTEVMNEINMTPLVDVMLVLLIIFIITVPVMKHAVNVELPSATSQPQNTKPETLQLSVDAQGGYFLNQTAVAAGTLPAVLQAEAGNPSCIFVATRPCGMSLWHRQWQAPSRLVCEKSAS
jgi:biopolymer transport protein ExbD